jgi:hypothetical protein
VSLYRSKLQTSCFSNLWAFIKSVLTGFLSSIEWLDLDLAFCSLEWAKIYHALWVVIRLLIVDLCILLGVCGNIVNSLVFTSCLNSIQLSQNVIQIL